MAVIDHPAVLLLLAALVVPFVADALSPRRARVIAALPPPLRKRLRASTALFRLSLAFLIVALAGPRWGEGRAPDDFRRPLDIVIALDVSRSMTVPDGLGVFRGPGVEPTRLDRGLEIAAETVAALPGARVAVAVSRGRGMLAVPLTWDTGTVLSFLEAAGGGAMTGFGTNLESLADAAIGAFRADSPARRIIVLVSDGEELSGSLALAVERARQEGIRIAAVLVGSEEGGTFPGGGDAVSRANPILMRTTAARSGGIFIDGSDPAAAERLAASLGSSGALAAGGGGIGGDPAPQWFPFAALSLLALGASKALLLGKRRPNPQRGKGPGGDEKEERHS